MGERRFIMDPLDAEGVWSVKDGHLYTWKGLGNQHVKTAAFTLKRTPVDPEDEKESEFHFVLASDGTWTLRSAGWF